MLDERLACPNVSYKGSIMDKSKPENSRIWFVIADGARGRILSHQRRGFRLLDKSHAEILVEETWPEAALMERQLTRDRPGRSFESAGSARHAYGEGATHHDLAMQAHARSIAERLNKASLAGYFDELILIIPPVMLGHVRTALNSKASALLSAAHAKDITHLSEDALLEALPNFA